MAAFTQMAQAQQAQQAQAQAQAQAQQAQAPKAVAARGGLMRKVYYDDGGGVDDTGDDLTSGLDLSNSGILGSTAPAFDTGYASYSAPSAGDVFGNLSTSNALAALPTSQGSSSSGKGLSGLLQGLGLSAGTASTLASLGVTAASLAPIIGALTGATGKGATQPALPAQYTGALNPVATPQMNRTPNPNMQTMTPAQWLHYGEMPEQQFYQNNQVPSAATSTGQQVGSGQPALPPGLLAALMQTQGQGAAATSPAAQAATAQPVQPAYSGVPASGPGMAPIMRAHGGPTYMSQSPYTSAMAGHARGPGDGTSDDINAKLSDGEYVMDAPTVSLLGNGSNEAGARALDAMRQNVRKHAGQKLVKGRQPMHAKTPGQYMDAE